MTHCSSRHYLQCHGAGAHGRRDAHRHIHGAFTEFEWGNTEH